MSSRGKRKRLHPRGIGNRLAPAGHQHPLFSPWGTYYFQGRPCRIIEFHAKGTIGRKPKDGEQFTIRDSDGRL